MLFTSEVFIVYFLPIIFLLYYAFSFSRVVQNILLFVMSILFYAWGEPIYVVLMIFSILLNWYTCLLMEKIQEHPKKKKIALWISIGLNLFILFVFKYLSFCFVSINSLIGSDIFPKVELSLPIGISFYTFQAISYVVDVYRQETKAEKNPFYVGLYISFFPQLIAGPIVKYSLIADQIRNRKNSYTGLASGTCRFMTGFIKKILLANNFAVLADLIFNYSQMGYSQHVVPVAMAWLGCFAYTLQIYFDFSAYSDMAIGLGKIFGFTFPENFNYPYYATSIQDFWRRWHISLTSWFREYVYFPLGGSRGENSDQMIRNMFIVWILTGVWHGAGPSFIIWGLWHFVFQLAERFFEYGKSGTHQVIMRIYTLLVVGLGWVVFRATDLYQAGIYYLNMFGCNQNGLWNSEMTFLLKEYWMFIIAGILFSIPSIKILQNKVNESKHVVLKEIYHYGYMIVCFALFVVSMSYIVRGSYNPFIYFNF